MLTFHRSWGLSVAVVFLLVFLWGGIGWLVNRDPGKWFWRLLVLGQVGLGVQAAGGILVFARGGRTDVLHYAYGAFPFLVLFAAHRYSRRLDGLEWAAFAVSGLVIFGLLLRGFMTG